MSRPLKCAFNSFIPSFENIYYFFMYEKRGWVYQQIHIQSHYLCRKFFFTSVGELTFNLKMLHFNFSLLSLRFRDFLVCSPSPKSVTDWPHPSFWWVCLNFLSHPLGALPYLHPKLYISFHATWILCSICRPNYVRHKIWPKKILPHVKSYHLQFVTYVQYHQCSMWFRARIDTNSSKTKTVEWPSINSKENMSFLEFWVKNTGPPLFYKITNVFY